MSRRWIVIFFFALTGAASAHDCSPYVATTAGPQLTTNQIIKDVRRLSSPTLAISTLTVNAPAEALRLTRESTLTPAAWRRLVTLAHDRASLVTATTAETRDHALDVLLAQVEELRLPRPATLGFVRSFGNLLRGRPAAMTAPFEVDEPALIRQLFKVRPAADLRATSARLSGVPDGAKFADTFAETLRALFTDFATRPRGAYGDFDEWTATVDQFLREELSNADDETRDFVILALERRFLNLPALPSETDVLNQLRNARAVVAPSIPAIAPTERIIPVSAGRTRPKRTQAKPVETAAPAVANYWDEISLLSEGAVPAADTLYRIELRDGASVAANQPHRFAIIEISAELAKTFTNARGTNDEFATWYRVMINGRQNRYDRRGLVHTTETAVGQTQVAFRLHDPALPVAVTVTERKDLGFPVWRWLRIERKPNR